MATPSTRFAPPRHATAPDFPHPSPQELAGTPKKARLNKLNEQPPLFDGCHFYFSKECDRDVPKMPKLAQLEELVNRGGGKVRAVEMEGRRRFFFAEALPKILHREPRAHGFDSAVDGCKPHHAAPSEECCCFYVAPPGVRLVVEEGG